VSRLRSILVVSLFAVLGIAMIGVSFVAAIFFIVAGFGFASPLFLVLGLLATGLFAFSIYFGLKVLLPFGRLLLTDE
jgi:hypothetical protein